MTAPRFPQFVNDAADQLERLGLVARVPYLRSSGYETGCHDEFLFYLKYRLGLRPGLSYSQALNDGSWFHAHAAAALDIEAPSPWSLLEARKAEIVALLSGASAARVEAILEQEVKDYQTTRAWWETACTLPIGRHGTLLEFLTNPRFRVLGSEVNLRVQLPHLRLIAACRLDLLLLDTVSNLIWIVDWKTSAEDTETRLSTCIYEFQTNHYLSIISLLLQKSWFRKRYDLTADTQLGGMFHFAFTKPGIRLSGLDRDFTVDTTKPTAPRTYHGEPKFENYLSRLRERLSEPQPIPVTNFSRVDAGLLLSDSRMYRYRSDLGYLINLATRPATPYTFRANINSVRSHGSLSPWAPFYYVEPRQWPSVLSAGNFVIGQPDDQEQYEGPRLRPSALSGRRERSAVSPALTRHLQEQAQAVSTWLFSSGEAPTQAIDMVRPRSDGDGDGGDRELCASNPPGDDPASNPGHSGQPI